MPHTNSFLMDLVDQWTNTSFHLGGARKPKHVEHEDMEIDRDLTPPTPPKNSNSRFRDSTPSSKKPQTGTNVTRADEESDKENNGFGFPGLSLLKGGNIKNSGKRGDDQLAGKTRSSGSTGGFVPQQTVNLQKNNYNKMNFLYQEATKINNEEANLMNAENNYKIAMFKSAPRVMSDWLSFLFNAAIVSVALYVMWHFYMALHNDIEARLWKEIERIRLEIEKCEEDYERNNCATNKATPEFGKLCRKWELCMERDPRQVAYRTNFSASILAEALNAFFNTLSLNTLVGLPMFVFSLLCACRIVVYVSGFAQRPQETDDGPQTNKESSKNSRKRTTTLPSSNSPDDSTTTMLGNLTNMWSLEDANNYNGSNAPAQRGAVVNRRRR